MFFPDNDYGYILEYIDFTSINNFGISINVTSRNAALLLPSIFLYISFYLFRKLLGISRLINNDFLISQIPKLNDRNKLFLTINYWSLVIFLLCTGSRVGIFIGYALSIIYILKIKYFLFRDYNVISNNEERKYINIQLINKNIIITLFVLSLIVGFRPYNFIFPMSCRNEKKYNTVLINSTIPIKHELKQVINIFQNKESNQNNNDNSSCNVLRFWEQKKISFNEFSSSSVESRLDLYKSDNIGHESMIKDILSPLKLDFLTIPLTLMYLIIYFFILIRFIILNLNFNKINYSLFNFDFILFIGSIYFVFNSIITPSAAISFGALYLNPIIKRINKMI